MSQAIGLEVSQERCRDIMRLPKSVPAPWQRTYILRFWRAKKSKRLKKCIVKNGHCLAANMICMEASRTLVKTSKVIEAQYQFLHFRLQMLLDINESEF